MAQVNKLKRKMNAMERKEAMTGYLYLLPNFPGFLLYSLTSVPLTVLLALLLALMLNRGVPGGGFFKTVYFFPNLTSMVAVSCVAMLLFDPVNGPINHLLMAFGVPEENLPKWFFSSKSALMTVVTVVVWKQAG
jgi:multiple sugar transport system permease protein/alpha-1,4-digalacturonate transport system permease protein